MEEKPVDNGHIVNVTKMFFWRNVIKKRQDQD